MAPGDGIVAVLGATGLQGGAVTRRLQREGWHVRALTRDPADKKTAPLRELGVDVMRADMDDPATLDTAFEGVDGVFSVQNHHISGYEGEVRQGKNVTDAVIRTGVPHLVWGAAGLRRRTGVGSWDTKESIAEYIAERGAPVTTLRPMAFMELMTDKKYFPPASVWNVMPRLMGGGRPVGWLAVDDLAAIVAKAFAAPQEFIGEDLTLCADIASIDECRVLWRDVTGRPPRKFPMPTWLFERFVGTDETTMWRWLANNEIELPTKPTMDVHPEAMTVRDWMERQHGGASA